MQLNLEHPDMLYAKPGAGKSDTVSIGRELNALEAAACLEARVTRLLGFGLDARKKLPNGLSVGASWLARRKS